MIQPSHNKRNDANGRRSALYETYRDFAENTSIHGLKYTILKEIGIIEKKVLLSRYLITYN